MPPLKDLTGQTFGRLTVLKRMPNGMQPNGTSYTQRLVKCSCGETEPFIIRGANLTRKNGTKFCGCLHKESAAAQGHKNKKYNEYDLTGEFGIGYTSKKEPFYFDLEDYDKIKNYCWFYKSEEGPYVVTNEPGSRKHIKTYRLIMGVTNPEEQVDHIKHITYDNRRSQLRIVSNSQNNMNRGYQSNNTSGVIGVSFSGRDQKWISEIQKDGKKYYLGQFDNFNDAVKARKEAEEKYFGEYSYDNSQKKTEEL